MIEKQKEVYPGKLIAVEGIDGSGKSTQIYLVKRWLELSGYRVFFTEWNSSVLVKQATKRGKKNDILTPTTFSLIHAPLSVINNIHYFSQTCLETNYKRLTKYCSANRYKLDITDLIQRQHNSPV